jgi:hypothetical protein
LKKFFELLGNILNYLLKPSVTLLICGDLNINLLVYSSEATKLLTLMKSYNLQEIGSYPTRITHCTESLLDVTFVDTTMFTKIKSIPLISSLSDHNAQITCLYQTNTPKQKVIQKKKIRILNNDTICYFQELLMNETWEQIYNSPNVNEAFNKFQEILIRYYEASFPISYVKNRVEQNKWITKGIKISCTKKKRTFFKMQDVGGQYADEKLL